MLLQYRPRGTLQAVGGMLRLLLLRRVRLALRHQLLLLQLCLHVGQLSPQLVTLLTSSIL